MAACQHRAQALQQGVVLQKNKLSRAALEKRLRQFRLRAAQVVEHRQQRLVARHEARRLRSIPVEDTSPIPEAYDVQQKLPPYTQILMSNPHTRDWSLQLALWQVTRKCHRRLWITTPYYMPHRKLTKAMLLAAKRGVDVRIMAGSRTTTDPWFMWYASQYLSARFLHAGVRIYEFQGGQIMHAKTMVADSMWSCVGSYNFDSMSNKNMEVCVTHFGGDVARMLEGHFVQDMAMSKELKVDGLDGRSVKVRVLSFLAYHGLRLLEKLTFLDYSDPDLQSQLE